MDGATTFIKLNIRARVLSQSCILIKDVRQANWRQLNWPAAHKTSELSYNSTEIQPNSNNSTQLIYPKRRKGYNSIEIQVNLATTEQAPFQFRCIQLSWDVCICALFYNLVKTGDVDHSLTWPVHFCSKARYLTFLYNFTNCFYFVSFVLVQFNVKYVSSIIWDNNSRLK